MWSYYDWVYCCCRPSVNTICGRVMFGLSLLSSVSKHNMWSYYDWVYCFCRPSVNTICGRVMIGLSLLSSVSKHNILYHFIAHANPYYKLLYSGEDLIRWKNLCPISNCYI